MDLNPFECSIVDVEYCNKIISNIRQLSTFMQTDSKRVWLARELFGQAHRLCNLFSYHRAGIELRARSDHYKRLHKGEFIWVQMATSLLIQKFVDRISCGGRFLDLAVSRHQGTPNDLDEIERVGIRGLDYLEKTRPELEEGPFQAYISDYMPELERSNQMALSCFKQDLEWCLNIGLMPNTSMSLLGFITCVIRIYEYINSRLAEMQSGGISIDCSDLGHFRRIIVYFIDFQKFADKNHERGCYWLRESFDFDNFNAVTTLFSLNLADSFNIILAAAEDLFVFDQGFSIDNHPPVGTAHEAFTNANNDTESVANGPTELSTETADDEESDTDEDNNSTLGLWHERDEYPDYTKFYNIPLKGTQWQIAWALWEKPRILNAPDAKTLRSEIRFNTLWGIKNGNRHIVYVESRAHSEHAVKTALEELNKIKDRGPYRHCDHETEPRYDKYKNQRLTCDSENILIKVLYGAEIIAGDDRAKLHKLMRKGGAIFGTYGPDGFTLLLSEGVEMSKVRKAQELLDSELKKRSRASLSSGSENSQGMAQ